MPACAGMIFFILARKSEICNRKAAQIAAKKRETLKDSFYKMRIFFSTQP